MGEQSTNLHWAKRNQERYSHLTRSRSSSPSSSGIHKAKVSSWQGFYFTGVMVQVGRPGYKIDTVLSRGALERALAYQSERAQTFAYFTSSFLVLIWLLSWWGLGACRDFNDKLKSFENEIWLHLLLHFRWWRFCWLRKGSHLPTHTKISIAYSYLDFI